MKKIVALLLLSVIFMFPSCQAMEEWDGTHVHFEVFPKPFDPITKNEHIAHIRIKDIKSHLAPEKRREYVIEIIEWLKGGDGEKKISAYSPSYQNKYRISVAEYYESSEKKIYEENNTYVVGLDKVEGVYSIKNNYYIPLQDLASSKGINDTMSVLNVTQTIDEMTPTDFLFYLKEYISNSEES